MRTIETKVYKFDELSEEAKERVVNRLYDVNVDHDWWDCTYYDAKNVGIKITAFDLGRGCMIEGQWTDGPVEAHDLILREHGNQCQTFKTAAEYMKARDLLVAQYSDGINIQAVTKENEYAFDVDCDELEKYFLLAILQDYLSILDKEYEYLTSEEAIIERIEANGYEFTEEGIMI